MTNLPPLPEGFVIEDPQGPEGFGVGSDVPPLPEGFVLEGEAQESAREGAAYRGGILGTLVHGATGLAPGHVLPESGKAFAHDLGGVVGSGLKSSATIPAAVTRGRQVEIERMLDAASEDPEAAAREMVRLSEIFSGEDRAGLLRMAERLRAGESVEQVREEAGNLPVMGKIADPEQTGRYQAGEQVIREAQERFPRGEGYEDKFFLDVVGSTASLLSFAGISSAVGPVGSFSFAGMLGAQEAYDRARANGMEPEEALDYAFQGVIPGAIQAAPAELILRKLPGGKRRNAMTFLRRVGEAFGGEFTVENLGAVLHNFVEAQHNPDKQWNEGVPMQGVTSGTGAAGIQALFIALARRGPKVNINTRDVWQEAREKAAREMEARREQGEELIDQIEREERRTLTPEERTERLRRNRLMAELAEVDGVDHPVAEARAQEIRDALAAMDQPAGEAQGTIPPPPPGFVVEGAEQTQVVDVPRETTSEQAPAPTAEPDAPRLDARERAAELRRLADQTADPSLRQTLLRDAEIAETEAEGRKPKLTPAERARQVRIVRPKEDHLILAIQKLGGIDTNIDSDWSGRLSHLTDRRPGLPAIERPGKGRSLDDLAESLFELGYIPSRDKSALEARLWDAEDGTPQYSMAVEADKVMTDMEQSGRPQSALEADYEGLPAIQDMDEYRAMMESRAEQGAGPAQSAVDLSSDLAELALSLGVPEGAVDSAFGMETADATAQELIRLIREARDATQAAQVDGRREEAGQGEGVRPPQEARPVAAEAAGESPPALTPPPGQVTQQARPRAEQETDLLGPVPTQQQALADRQRAVDERLSPTEEAPAPESAGDMLDPGRARQADIADAPSAQTVTAPREAPPAPQQTPAEAGVSDSGGVEAAAAQALPQRAKPNLMQRVLAAINNGLRRLGFEPGPRIESHIGNMARGRAFFDSVSDVLRRQPRLRRLADAIDNYYDGVDKYRGEVDGHVRPVMQAIRKLPRARQREVFENFKRYQAAKENGRKKTAETLRETGGEHLRSLIEAWEWVADHTGEINQKVGVEVYDPMLVDWAEVRRQVGGQMTDQIRNANPKDQARMFADAVRMKARQRGLGVGDVSAPLPRKGGWRRIGRVKGFWPRAFRPEVQEALHNPARHPELWNQMVDALIAEGHIGKADEAGRYLRQHGESYASDYFAGIEKARTQPLPEMFYDYSWDSAMVYKEKWARRVSQIEQFGQKKGDKQGDLFGEVLKKVHDERTRNYLIEVMRDIYMERPVDATAQFIGNLNIVATGIHLGNPFTATRNWLTGMIYNWANYGSRPSILAFGSMIRDINRAWQNAYQAGVLKEDLISLLHDAEQQGVSQRLSKGTSFLMRWGGYNITEQWIRVHAMLTGRHFLLDALRHWNRNIASAKSKRYLAFMQRHNIDTEALIRENGVGPETDKWLRLAVNIPQGSYKLNMVPLFVDTPIGRFLWKYQKYGTQRSREFWQNGLRPFIKGDAVAYTDKDGVRKSERVRSFEQLLRYFVAATVGGTATAKVLEVLFGTIDPGPGLDELEEALKDEDRKNLLGLLFARAWHSAQTLGALGFFQAPIQATMDVADRQRMKSPLSPPGLAPIEAVGEMILRYVDQGGVLTARDIDNTLNRTLSMYRASKRAGLGAINLVTDEVREAQLEALRRDRLYVRKLTRRYAAESDLRGKRRASGSFGATEMTPVNRRIHEEILLGNAETARQLAIQAMREAETNRDVVSIAASIKASVRAFDPARISTAPSEYERAQFLEWVEGRVSDENYQRVRRITDTYRDAAIRAGLMSKRHEIEFEIETLRRQLNESLPRETLINRVMRFSGL